jgi:hypothetical protein
MPNSAVRMVNVVEATIGDGLRAGVEGTMEVWKFYDSDRQAMVDVRPCVVVSVKASNIRSKQSVAGAA